MAQVTEPKADTQQDTGPEARRSSIRPVGPYLFVVLECDRPSAGGARYSLAEEDEIVLGRGPERTAVRERVRGERRLVLRLPGRAMSSLHARIRRQAGGWLFEDAGSTNGSLVNGVKVKRYVLGEGDLVEVGHSILTIHSAYPASSSHDADLDASAAAPLDPAATLVPQFRSSVATLLRVAASNLPLVLVGPTGTGKDVLARAVHRNSARPGEFVPMNCAALPPNLAESHLFGHVRGAFSGAVRDEPGFLRRSHRGTLFLDEVGDLSEFVQADLLRALQNGEVVPVGASRATEVDLRIIAATQQPLEILVANRRFRSDLRARLEGFTLELPPLADRWVDLGTLVASVLSVAGSPSATLSRDVGRALCAYSWPLNIRELEHTLRRALALAGGLRIELEHLPRCVASTSIQDRTRARCGVEQRARGDAQLRSDLIAALDRHRGNISEIARTMGKARMQVQRWIRRFGLDASAFRA